MCTTYEYNRAHVHHICYCICTHFVVRCRSRRLKAHYSVGCQGGSNFLLSVKLPGNHPLPVGRALLALCSLYCTRDLWLNLLESCYSLSLSFTFICIGAFCVERVPFQGGIFSLSMSQDVCESCLRAWNTSIHQGCWLSGTCSNHTL